MPEKSSFDYAVIRLVPYVDREEFINVGVILFCRTQKFLAARIHLNQKRALALAPALDLAQVKAQLELFPLICAGGPNAGPIGQESQAERFHWLISPRSAVIQVSAAHTGLCSDPQATLDGLFKKLVIQD